MEARLLEKHGRSLDPNMFVHPTGELIAYPSKSHFVKEPDIYRLSIERDSGTDVPLLEFAPPVMDLGPRAVGMPTAVDMKVTNAGQKTVIITQMFVDTLQLTLQHSKKLPIHVRPGRTVKFVATLTPSVIGELSAFAYFRTSNNKTFVYKVYAISVENSYELNPVLRTALPIGEIAYMPLHIYNPSANETLRIHCVKSFDSSVRLIFTDPSYSKKLCAPDGPVITIPPMTKDIIAMAYYTPTASGFHYSHIFVTGPNLLVGVPLFLRAHMHPVLLHPRTLDFGTIPLDSKPHVLEIGISIRAPVMVHGIHYKPDPDLKLVLPGLETTPRTFGPSHSIIKLGYAVFYAMHPGTYSGKIYLLTNTSGVMEFEYSAEVVPSPDFTADPIEISAGRGKVKSAPIVVRIDSPAGLKTLTRVETSSKNFTASLICHQVHPIAPVLDRCTFFPVFMIEPSLNISLNYTAIQRKRLPMNLCITVSAGESLHTLPITVYDANIYCTYFRFEKATGKKFAVTRPCKEVREIEVGAYGNSINYFEFNITHSKSSPVSLENLKLVNASGSACFDRVRLFEISQGKVESVDVNRRDGFRPGTNVNIPPGAVLNVKIILSSSFCSLGAANKGPAEPEDGTSLRSQIAYTLNGTKHAFRILAEYRRGELAITPSTVTFAADFPGTAQYAEIYATSSFHFPITILAAKSTDYHVEVSNVVRTIQPGSKVRLARVTFDPFKVENGDKSEVIEMSKKGVSIGELRGWKRKSKVWETLTRSVGQYVDACVYLETDLVQQIKVPIKAELAFPKVTNVERVEFLLTQKGGSSKGELLIQNPSMFPLAVQLVLAQEGSFSSHGEGFKEKCMSWLVQNNNQTRRSPKTRAIDKKTAEYCCASIDPKGFSRAGSGEDAGNTEPEDFEPEYQEPLCDDLLVFVHSSTGTQTGGNPAKIESFWNRFFFPSVGGSKSPMKPTTGSAFSIPPNYTAPIVLPPGTHVKVKRIMFAPQRFGMHEATLFIKNNLTVLQPVKLVGRGGSGIVEFTEVINMRLSKREEIHGIASDNDQSKAVPFSIVAADVLEKIPESEALAKAWPVISGLYELLRIFTFSARQIHERAYLIRNRGNLPLVVSGISVAGRGCAAYGISIQNCIPFVLKPSEVATVFIRYRISGGLTSITKPIIFTTPYGEQTFPLKITMTPDVLSLVQRYPRFGSRYEAYIRLLLCISLIVSSAVIAFTTLGEAFLVLTVYERRVMERLVKKQQLAAARPISNRAELIRKLHEVVREREALFPPVVSVPREKVVPKEVSDGAGESAKMHQAAKEEKHKRHQSRDEAPTETKVSGRKHKSHRSKDYAATVAEEKHEQTVLKQSVEAGDLKEETPKGHASTPDKPETSVNPPKENPISETRGPTQVPQEERKVTVSPQKEPIPAETNPPPSAPPEVAPKPLQEKYQSPTESPIKKYGKRPGKRPQPAGYVSKHTVFVRKHAIRAGIEKETSNVEDPIDWITGKLKCPTNAPSATFPAEGVEKSPEPEKCHPPIENEAKQVSPIGETPQKTQPEPEEEKKQPLVGTEDVEPEPEPEIFETYNPFSSLHLKLPDNLVEDPSKGGDDEGSNNGDVYYDVFKDHSTWGGYSFFSETHPLIKPVEEDEGMRKREDSYRNQI